jgi:hypothetical protein
MNMASSTRIRQESVYAFAPYTYEVRWVPIQSIAIPVYQHPAYVHAVKQLKDDFDARSYGFITLSERDDGSLWVLDGQTRLKVHEELSIPTIKAEIRRGLSEAEEARLYLFLSRNAVRGMADQFTARVMSHDAIAVTIKDVLDRLGLVLTRFGQRDLAGQQAICCAKKLDQLVRHDPTGERLESTLSLIFSTWGYSAMAVSHWLVDVIATFLERYDGRFIPAQFHQRLSAQTVPMLRADALVLRNAKPQMSLKACVLERVLDAYNHGRPQAGRLE